LKLFKKALAVLLFLALILFPAHSTYDLVERPIYGAALNYKPENHLLSGQLSYKLPPGKYKKLVFNLWANAFSQGKNGHFVFPQFYNAVFYQGDSRGELSINNVRVNGIEANYSIEGISLIVTPPQTLLYDRAVYITMDYAFRIPVIGHRVGANSYSTWAGNFLPLLAVQENEAWLTYPYYAAGDPFYSKNADFFITVAAPAEYAIIAPGLKLQNDETIAIAAQNVRDFALAISDKYKTTTRLSRQGIELSISTLGISSTTITRLLDDLEDMIDYFTEEVGPYPYPSLVLAQITWFVGGMEYPGLIFLSQNTLLNFYSARSTMLHELAHQWFYAVIGNNQVTESWIDEGFATFFQNRYLYGQDIHSYYAQEKQALANLLASVPDSRLGQPLGIYDDWVSYHRVNYRRSSLLQYELFALMGPTKYRSFTRKLYNEFKYKELDRQNLIKLASEVYGADLGPWFDPWFND